MGPAEQQGAVGTDRRHAWRPPSGGGGDAPQRRTARSSRCRPAVEGGAALLPDRRGGNRRSPLQSGPGLPVGDLVTITNDVRLLSGAAATHVRKFKELTNQNHDESDKDNNPSSY